MSKNKQAYLRYKILDQCFRNTGRKYQIKDLQKAVDQELSKTYPSGNCICRKTIYNDIDFMSSDEGWNIKLDKTHEGRNVYYRYADPTFSIINQPLTEDQINFLKSTFQTLSTFQGLPQLDWLQDGLSKFELFTLNQETPCVDFENNIDLVGLQHLPTLYNAIQYHTVLKIVYKPFDRDPQTHTLHPQYLKQYNKRWYILGVTSQRPTDITNFPIDRIQSITPTNETYIESTTNWQDIFDDIVGITYSPNLPAEDIEFLVFGKIRHYLETNPIHSTQRVTHIDDDTIKIHLNVQINHELKRVLLSYAHSIKILAPQSLIEAHKQQLQDALSHYEE